MSEQEADFIDLLNAFEAAIVQYKMRVAKRHRIDLEEDKGVPAASEKNFSILKYVRRTGPQLGEFEIADEKDNPPDLYNRAFNILRQSQATISNRYHGESYLYSYWEYQNKIWRQKN